MSKIIILGSSSLLSKELTQRFEATGHNVSLAGRNCKPYYFNIESSSSFSIQEFDVIIFVSWIQSPRNSRMRQKNEQAVKSLVRSLTEHQNLVFISSQAASGSARSQYGKGKYNAELSVKIAQKYLIIRPATIIGKATLTGEISKSFVARLLTTNGKFLAPSTVDLQALADEIVKKLTNSEFGSFELTSSEGWKSKSMLISQIVRIITWPLVFFRGDFADRTLSYIDLKFPTN